MKPRGGPARDPSVVLVQLEDATRQLADLQEEAQQLAKVSTRVYNALNLKAEVRCEASQQ